MTTREIEELGDTKIAGRRVAFYGYGLYVSTENKLDAIYSRHLRLVMQQRVKDWRELAGLDVPDCEGPIHLFGPAKSTRGGLVLAPLARIWFAEATWTVLDSDAEIVAAVAADPLALGFASLGFDGEGVRYLGLRGERGGEPVLPSLEAIEDERYGLAKLIYVYYATPPSAEVQAVLDYLFGAEGQRAIEETKLWPVALDRAVAEPTE